MHIFHLSIEYIHEEKKQYFLFTLDIRFKSYLRSSDKIALESECDFGITLLFNFKISLRY